jgi:hypothetical protein
MDASLIENAKKEAARRGKSVSQMVGDFFGTLGSSEQKRTVYPPVTSSLIGVVKESDLSEEDYKKHLREKHL